MSKIFILKSKSEVLSLLTGNCLTIFFSSPLPVAVRSNWAAMSKLPTLNCNLRERERERGCVREIERELERERESAFERGREKREME